VNDADLSGLDLREASFSGDVGTTGVMQRTNFSGSNLVQTLFDNVDLTGSNFAGAVLVDDRGYSVSFTGTLVCPDGAPVDTTVRGAAACRL
jgi:uncharacterized protein YjbI with pentapeptide repeats